MTTLHRHHKPFHPSDAYWVRRAYRLGYQSGQRGTGFKASRARWLKRHADEYILTRQLDWEDGYLDGQMAVEMRLPHD